MDYIYPDKPFQNTINVLAASILNENLITSDIETTLLARGTSLRQVQSCREIGVLFSTEQDPNRLEKRVRESPLSLAGGKSNISQPNRRYQNRPVRPDTTVYEVSQFLNPLKLDHLLCCRIRTKF
ncbi:hypothetical protein AVEN_10372-1 [Araneus ventricosus]|uniref:Uncharacterized protein n=1 Tax=Araneus ventricosus TaxID=182803 RepID=A0A4Y2GZ25_ARAVE|nr:hypothetical protein AVEN_10372-1 [Araneus ventricosus]